MTKALFWFAIIGTTYSYFLYPLVLRLFAGNQLALEPDDPQRADDALPHLTVIVAARNEETRLPGKIEDLLLQDYPSEKLDILIVSDGSTDKTAEIARSFAKQGVRCLELEERRGKESAQARAIQLAHGQLLVFTDVATRIGGAGLRGIASALMLPGIGAVSSEDHFVSADGRPVGEGLYVRYEMWLRQLESRTGGLVGLSGSLFGVRRELCDEWPTHVPSDMVVALRTARRGLRAISLSQVYGLYPDLKDAGAEFARKRRTAMRGLAALAYERELLDPRRYGVFAFQLWSHKILRWAAPWFMALALLTNIALAAGSMFFTVTLGLQLLFYGLVGLAALWPPARRFVPIRIVYFFVLSNLALAAALVDYLRGHRVVQWEPSVR
jgi:cellulose synthase/poly-beta-1,6-N-acetylglucosamine synthase-like glycosyltransferase